MRPVACEAWQSPSECDDREERADDDGHAYRHEHDLQRETSLRGQRSLQLCACAEVDAAPTLKRVELAIAAFEIGLEIGLAP